MLFFFSSMNQIAHKFTSYACATIRPCVSAFDALPGRLCGQWRQAPLAAKASLVVAGVTVTPLVANSFYQWMFTCDCWNRQQEEHFGRKQGTRPVGLGSGGVPPPVGL